MILAVGSQGELEAHGDLVVDGVNGALSDPVGGQVAHRPIDLQIPGLDLGFVHEDGVVEDGDLMVSVPGNCAEGDAGPEGEFEGSSVGQVTKGSFLVVSLVWVVQVGEGGGGVGGGVVGVANGGGGEVGYLQEGVDVVARGVQAEGTFRHIFPGVELHVEPVGVGR